MRLSPYGLDYRHDPAFAWREILAADPRVGYDLDLALWLIGGYANVRTALNDSVRFATVPALAPIKALSPAAAAVMNAANVKPAGGIVTSDAPQHATVRALLRAILPAAGSIAQHRWEDLVNRRVTQVIDSLADQASADLMQQIASRIPLLIILDVLGIAEDEADIIAGWSADALNVIGGDLTPERQLSAVKGYIALRRYCRELVDDRIAAAAAGETVRGIIGQLVAYRGGDDSRLAPDHVAALIVDLIIAGWETTAAALGHCLENGLNFAGRWGRLATDDHYLSTYVEEILRRHPPVDGLLRVAATSVELDGVIIPEGSRCLLLIGTAHHDWHTYDDPDTFDPGRARLGQHLGFGAGPHHCIGRRLARLQLTTTLRGLATQLPGLRLTPDYARQFRSSALIRIHTVMPAATIGAQFSAGQASLDARQQ